MELVVLTVPSLSFSPFLLLISQFHLNSTPPLLLLLLLLQLKLFLTQLSFHSLILFLSLEMEGKSRPEGGKRSLKEKAKKEEDAEEEEGFGSCDDDKRKKGPLSKKGSNGSSGGGGGVAQPSCQAENCTVDLSEAKRYHRRHKVCENHSKAPVVVVTGLRQRFCQQCSRFHELSEFDEAKRSCRRRLAGHNERRRKSSSESHGEGSSRKGASPQLKENHCRQADQSGRLPITLPENSSFKHFQIR